MKNYLLAILFSLVIVPGFSQPKPSKKEKPPTAKEMEDMHESILNNFNFKYVYDFFFDPQKVKGQAYKPLRSPLYTEAIVKKEGSESRLKNNANENVYYFEDFSNTPAGKKPIGWRCPVAFDGGSAVTAALEGMRSLFEEGRSSMRQLKIFSWVQGMNINGIWLLPAAWLAISSFKMQTRAGSSVL